MIHDIAMNVTSVAQADSPGGFILVVLAVGVFVVAVLGFLALVAARYKRCPSNRVLVIYGKGTGENSAKCVHGGAAFVVPVFQDFGWLSLEPLQIAIPLKDALSMENIRVSVPSVFTVAVGTEPAVMQNAAIRLLGLTNEEIQQQAQDIIFGQLRQVIASMKIEEINRDREAFLQNIQNSLEPELKKIGLTLINVNITDITDESGYIQAIGKKAASQAVQQARGDVAEQEKLGEVRVAEAMREKEVMVAAANKDREIGMRAALRDQAVRVAEMDRDQQIAEQTAAYQRETQVTNAEREKRVTVADANAKAIAGEATAKAEIANTNATLRIKEAEAYQASETRKREAEAAVQEAQNRAMAKAALAEAERVEAEHRAALEAPAKAQKAKLIVEAQADAEKRKLDADAEAHAIFAKREAEARGEFEMLARKGEGLKAIIEACGGADQAFQMLLLEQLEHLADASAKAISNIKFDKVVVWENGSNANGQTATSNFLQNLGRTLPPMLQTMRDIGGVEIPESIVRLADGDHSRHADARPATDGKGPISPAEALAQAASKSVGEGKKN
ncbi:MAG: flotillin family protein [Phycisphaerae bacterium]